MGRYVLRGPGTGIDPVVDLDEQRLTALVARELTPVVTRALASRAVRYRLAPATVARKRRGGSGSPSTPLVDTGQLQRSIRVVRTDDGLAVECNYYAAFLPQEEFRALLQMGEVDAAINRALEKHMEGV